MSEWITDRLPTKEDADSHRFLWITANGKVFIRAYDRIDQGTPWMPITPPEPYVAPKPKYFATPHREAGIQQYRWAVSCDIGGIFADHIPTREAAERIANIYNEVIS